uniref:EF-hand domain-containing protein n=1 Tax=Panagrellus redivivus TaxID=6233 RepID=A0A7E4VTZ6_PANRE
MPFSSDTEHLLDDIIVSHRKYVLPGNKTQISARILVNFCIVLVMPIIGMAIIQSSCDAPYRLAEKAQEVDGQKDGFLGYDEFVAVGKALHVLKSKSETLRELYIDPNMRSVRGLLRSHIQHSEALFAQIQASLVNSWHLAHHTLATTVPNPNFVQNGQILFVSLVSGSFFICFTLFGFMLCWKHGLRTVLMSNWTLVYNGFLGFLLGTVLMGFLIYNDQFLLDEGIRKALGEYR